ALSMRAVDVLLINGELKPSQHYLLESELKVECMDRIRLVLEIFDDRAYSREARLQVQRARLRYEIPLLREWIHNARGGEHPGFLGGGAYETDAYYELIRRQLARIEDELKKIESDRDLRRKRRARCGLGTIALAGYTNAGKSSLLNAITSEEVLVEDRMFSTLSTTTSRLEGCRKQLLVTDTIGFISNLPHFMIESFKSTLDEIFYADLVLLVIDSSDDEEAFIEKLNTSLRILFPEVDATGDRPDDRSQQDRSSDRSFAQERYGSRDPPACQYYRRIISNWKRPRKTSGDDSRTFRISCRDVLLLAALAGGGIPPVVAA
ncbi:MAG TPA: GTPase HflX, partial [Methanomassiliicoccaceae archaeon]|nr:GTPase HflX [Methanomassiliicoccaceae archaeon]